MMMKRFSLLAASLCLVTAGYAQSGDRYALLIGGLGGSAEYTERFQQYLFDTRKALIENHGFAGDHVVVLGETKLQNLDFVDGVSLEETIRAEFGKLAGRVTAEDHVYVILYGHGGFDGTEARFNIPRADLTQGQYAELVNGLDAGRVIFINTASASAPFVAALSGAGRIVITATRVGSQKNETFFPGFLVDGLTSPAADRDKDGSLSVLEWYTYAAEKTDQWFTDNGNIPTENALIDDNGDGKGTRLNELESGADGNLAGLTYVRRRDAMLAASVGTVSASWLREKEQIEQAIADVKSRKSGMETEVYYAELETLFVRLARGNEAAEQGQ
ncbi:MAG: hypothetical protein R2834_03260 [Rhodothermales bacterium]